MANSLTTNGMVRGTGREAPKQRRLRHPGSDHYTDLLDTILSASNRDGGPLKSIGITSSNRREGVTTVACNLALHAACLELHTLLVDGNLCNPGVHRNFQLPASPGLADLNGDANAQQKSIHDLSSRPFKSLPASLKHSIRRGMGVSRTTRNRESFSAPGLKILTSGQVQTDAGSMQTPVCENKKTSERLLKKIRDSFDLVIVDLPSVSEMKSYHFSLADLDGVILVLEAEATSDLTAHASLQQLNRFDANVLGVAFNKFRNRLPGWIERKLGD